MPIVQNKGLRGLPGLNSISEEERQAFMLANAEGLVKRNKLLRFYIIISSLSINLAKKLLIR